MEKLFYDNYLSPTLSSLEQDEIFETSESSIFDDPIITYSHKDIALINNKLIIPSAPDSSSSIQANETKNPKHTHNFSEQLSTEKN